VISDLSGLLLARLTRAAAAVRPRSSCSPSHDAIEPASDADMLRHLMEAKGVTQAQLSRDTHIPESTISEVLAEKKPFSRQTIRKLADYFKVDVSVLAANL
jgi:HTH-type transcriptional regulator/antitoxin HigA